MKQKIKPFSAKGFIFALWFQPATAGKPETTKQKTQPNNHIIN